MAEEPTCGQGLAQHADLPLLIGELMGSVADNLSAHLSRARVERPGLSA